MPRAADSRAGFALRAVRHLQRTPLDAKLAVLSAALTAGVVGATFAVLSARAGATTRALYADELGREQTTLLNLRHEQDQQLVVATAQLAESPTLRSALGTARFDRQRADLARTVERELARVAPDLGRDIAAVTDAEGRLFAAAGATGALPAMGTSLATLPAVRAALDPSRDGGNGDQYLSVLRVGAAHFHVAAVPLVIDGITLGTVLLGDRIDSAHVAGVGRSLGGQVVVAAGGRPIASTLPAALAATVPVVSARPRPVTAGGVEYVAASLPVGTTQDGADVRMTLLQPVTPAVERDTLALLRDFALFGVLAVLLAGLGAAAIARTVLEPLQTFVRALRSGARGGTGPTFDADRVSVEVRALDESFTQLMSTLAKERGELERRGAELAAANSVLTAEIADRARVERALRDSEAQLRQSQKLEAVGTLAGGVAHDFNNLLTVISGYTQLAVMRTGKDSPAAEDLRQVVAAADHAGVLTQQLLAFSRKQVMQPRVLDLGDAVAGVEGMLRRLIGAHITLVVDHDGQPMRVKADPGQLEQVLMNLAVNARDAMHDGGGGTLTISLGNGALPNGAPAVTLVVRDTGTGMPAAVRDRIFEPFFTTKAPGKGTGLGLATVYGIVAQSGGVIAVDSEPGIGTAFTIALPAVGDAAPAESTLARDTSAPPRGTETVLLVEDTDAVRALAARALESCGYTVLAARSGVEALDLARQHGGAVDLLLTDVVMPGISGPQLAERLAAERPNLCVMYMSGYADDAILQFELDPGTAFLRKPFTPSILARAVREAVDTHRAEPLPFLR